MEKCLSVLAPVILVGVCGKGLGLWPIQAYLPPLLTARPSAVHRERQPASHPAIAFDVDRCCTDGGAAAKKCITFSTHSL